jgi:hypothetical protein
VEQHDGGVGDHDRRLWSETLYADASMEAVPAGGKVFLTAERQRGNGVGTDSLVLGPLDPDSARDALRRYDAMLAGGGRPAIEPAASVSLNDREARVAIVALGSLAVSGTAPDTATAEIAQLLRKLHSFVGEPVDFQETLSG